MWKCVLSHFSRCLRWTLTIYRRKPAEVVSQHKRWATVLFSGLVIAIFACEAGVHFSPYCHLTLTLRSPYSLFYGLSHMHSGQLIIFERITLWTKIGAFTCRLYFLFHVSPQHKHGSPPHKQRPVEISTKRAYSQLPAAAKKTAGVRGKKDRGRSIASHYNIFSSCTAVI